MKHNYLFFQRYAWMCILALLLVAITTNQSQAQHQPTGLEAGVFRIKVTEDLFTQLEHSRMTKNAGNVLVTGIKSIDRASLQHKVTGMKRVFRQAGKFEARHRRYGLHRWFEVKLDKAASVAAALSTFKGIEQIEIAEAVHKKAIIGSDQKDFGPRVVDIKELATLASGPNDPMFAQQWHYNNNGQAGGTPGSDISILQAWGIETGSSNVIVAVTDGGAQVDHPDLAANMWVNTGEIAGNNIDDDNNGYVDDINGYGFGDNTGEIAPDDHGTHTSGTIAATTNNAIGVAGVAGGSGVGDGVRIMTCAAFGGSGVGGFEDTYVYGADNGAVISQNSWGYTVPGEFDQVVLDAIDYFIAEAGKDNNGNQVGPMKGGIVIFAAGNSDSNEQHYPGFYEATLTVGAVNNQDKKAWYSNFGEWVDLSAPGGETFVNNDPKGVLSTIAGGQYAFFQGTSMACPHVSGVAGLIISKFGGAGFTPEMLRGRLTQLVDNIDALDPDFAGLLGTGRLNAFSALQENDNDAPDAIDSLAVSAVGITTVTLTWTSPVDPGNGSATLYDIRYSTAPITQGNFNSASAVSNPPVPKPGGAFETFTVTGLMPATTYYFAVKSADFFGNFSAISNVVEQATNAAPIIEVSPTSLTVNLQTADTTHQTLTLTNNGEGTLNFMFVHEDSVVNFATAITDAGTVAAGESEDIDITIDASGLLAGTYHQNLMILTNDPLRDTVLIPVTLNVINNGVPIASVEPDSLNFGQLFETGSANRLVTVHNAGSDTLTVTAVTSSNADFTSDFDGALSVAPFTSETIIVTYMASSLGAASGVLTIMTNDPVNPVFTVFLEGEGVEAPNIEVSPDSLSATLNTGHTSVQTLSISNTGASNLEFSIAITAPAPVSVSSSKLITLPSRSATTKSGVYKQQSGLTAKYSNQIKVKSIGTSAVKIKVLILSPDDDVSDLEVILNSFDDIEATIFPKASLPSITLADIEDHDVVMTTNNSQWLQAAGVEPSLIGNLLADYIDAGGKVIVNQFAYSYDAWKMEGRFINEQYGPFTPATSDFQDDIALGDILAAAHPIIQGVDELQFTGFVQNVGLASGATAIATWENGDLLLAANNNVVALNLLPSLGNGDPLQWSGDLPTLYQNAIHYLAGPTFVSVLPKEGVVAPGQKIDLEVTFDASGLDAGVFTASIDILNNVPNKELISVPAVLTVLGPEFTVQPDTLYESLEKQQTSTRTVVLKNNGPDDHSFTVKVQGGSSLSTVVKKNLKPIANGRQASTSSQKRINPTGTDRKNDDQLGVKALRFTSSNARMASNAIQPQASTTLYTTDFENFDGGDINGQDGWFAQFERWTIETENPSSGSQHLRALSDGLGQSASVTPAVAIGTEDKSTLTMKVNVQGTGVTWQIIPQSPTAGFINTRIEFSADGSVSALVDNLAGGGTFIKITDTIPAGYFDLTLEVDKDSAHFSIYFDNVKVFSGQGFAGAIEEVVFVSLMEEVGPTFDVDDLQIIDGSHEVVPPFITVSPLSGNLPSGASVELTVMFDAGDLEFGTYTSNIYIQIDSTDNLIVPAILRVFGEPAIHVDPTVLQAMVDYKEDTTYIIHVNNTGGNPLTYSMQVIGAATDVTKLPAGPVSKFANRSGDKRMLDKKALDDRTSKSITLKPARIEVLTGVALLNENFEGASFPPSGWSSIDNEGNGVIWNFAAASGEGNYAGTGEAATASSDAFGEGDFDAELISPSISTAGYRNIAVQYNANYQNFGGLDFLDLDIQVDGGSWKNVLSWNEDHGLLREASGEFVTVGLASFVGSASTFRLRWHYYDPNADDFDWYAQIDDVVVLGDARVWLTVEPSSGIVPVGGTAHVAAKFDAEDVEPGFYVAGILVHSNAVSNPFIGIVASMQVREPSIISVEPDSLSQQLFVGASASQTVTISNAGESALKYSFGNAPVASAIQPNIANPRKTPISKRTRHSKGIVNLMDTRAITSSVTTLATPLYVTGFEEFTTGDINDQLGWAATGGSWTVEAENTFEGTQHFRGSSDGLGESLAFSPIVAIGSEEISSTAMHMNVKGSGVTWNIIPQSTTEELVNTRFQIAPDGGLSALVKDSVGNIFFTPINAILPDGYFEFRIEIVRATSVFTIYIDGESVFTGQGFAGDIEQVVVYSLMEEEGPTLDIDNLAIYDGGQEVSWLSVNPKSGTIPAGSSATVTVTFNASDLEEGIYTDSLRISSNDPEHATLFIPVVLTVLDNAPPVLQEISDTTVIELGSLDVTFTASDENEEAVTVVLNESLSFVTLVSATNGTATYSIKPKLGDAGEYHLPVIATDERGAIDTAVFHLTVIPYGVESFSVVYYKAGTVVTTFEDSVTLDVAHPDYAKLTIRANTNPAKIGSVKFWIDGAAATLENSFPYDLNRHLFADLSAGQHTIKADAFTRTRARGDQGKSKEAFLMVINSSSITDFDLIKRNGSKLMDVVEGSVIDISQTGYHEINLKVNTSVGMVKSVVFELNGASYRIDNKSPFALHGNASGKDLPWITEPGFYSLTATPYAQHNGQGAAGYPLTINFEVRNGSISSPAIARSGEPNDEVSMEENAEASWSIYPVPVFDKLHLKLSGKAEGEVGVMISNIQGATIFKDQGNATMFRDYSISTVQLGLPSGVYLVQIKHANGKRVTRKFIKQ